MSRPHDVSTSDLREVETSNQVASGHIETEMAALAARFVNSTNRNVFLTGKAGTGKTTLLRKLTERTHKRYVVLAPTGIAALNAGGVTIHSQFLLPFGSFIPERRLPPDVPAYGAFHDRDTLNRRHPLNAVRRSVLAAVDLLIIDEVSMLRADVLDAIDHRMRGVRQRWNEPFGGVQVLFIGDLYQLPPVVKDTEWEVLRRYYDSMHFFAAHALQQSGYAHVELDRIFRQQDDRFIRVLNNLREDTVTAEDVETLNAYYRPPASRIPPSPRERAGVRSVDTPEGIITLSTHNRTADDINQQALHALPGKAYRYEAEIDGEFPESMFPLQRTLELKEGAQVMFTRNDQEKNYFNGKLARVTQLNAGSIEVRMLDDDRPYKLKREAWENKRYTVNAATKEQQEEVLGVFEHYPIKLAWAITVHKSQGLTFDKAVIDVGRAFAPGQVYVALSRLRSLEGLILRTPIDPSVVSTDKDVVAFSNKRLSQQPLPEQLKEQQRIYLQAVLTSTFELGDISRRIEKARTDDADAESFADEAMRTALANLGNTLTAEEVNTRKFQGQLLRLLHTEERDALLERITKGAGYYGDMLYNGMKELLKHLAQVERLSRTKTYAEALREIDGMLVKKIGSIHKAAYLTTCILNGEEVGKQPEQEKLLKERREALVTEIKSWAEEHLPAATTKSGRKRRVRKGDDDVFADEEHVPTPRLPKGATYQKTYALLKEGRSMEEVAAERSMSPSTIEGHVAKGIAEGELEIDAFLPANERDSIGDWMREHPDKNLNDARANFGDAYTYGKLRMVQAWVKREE